jgi:translocation and assembly module TamB
MKWPRRIGWILTGLLVLIVLVSFAGYISLRSAALQRYALNKIVQQTDEATGARAQIGKLDFKLSTLSAHLYDITLRGTEPSGQPPLLHVDKLTVAIKIKSLLHHSIYLDQLLIEHPVAYMQVSRSGQNNLPQAPPSQSSSHTSVFDLAIRHLLLTNGEIYYNDKKTPLDADLCNLGTDIHFDAPARRYSGSISYDNGHIRYSEYSPLPHSLNAKFFVTPSNASLESAVLKLGSSVITLHADVPNYSNLELNGDYNIRIQTPDFREISPQVTPAGDVTLSGKIRYQRDENSPVLRTLRVDGQIDSDSLSATSRDVRLDVQHIQGRYKLADGRLVAHNIAEVFNGALTTDLDIQHLDSEPNSRVHATLRNISLRSAQHSMRAAKNEPLLLSGVLNGSVEASWTGSMNNMRAHSDLTLHAGAKSATAAAASSREVPVNGSIHASYDKQHSSITLIDTILHVSSTTLTAQGEVSRHSNLRLQATANDLHQLVSLASEFQTGQSRSLAISGSAALTATVQGSTKQPRLSGQLKAQNLAVQGSQWASASMSIQASPSQFKIENASLVNAHQGRATLSASVDLKNWSYQPANAIVGNLSVQQMSVADLQRLSNLQYPVSGNLSANFSLHGSQLNPEGSGEAQLTNGKAYDEPLQNLILKVRADKASILANLNLTVAAGSMNASLSYTPKTKAYNVDLEAPSIVLQNLHAVQTKNAPLTGTLAAKVTGKGTLDDPQLTATLQLPQLQVRQNSISGIHAELRVANHRADMNLQSQITQAAVQGHGYVNLTGDYYAEGAIDTSQFPLAPLLALYAKGHPSNFHGQSELHASFKGPLKDKSRLEAHVTIPTFSAGNQSLQIAAAGPIRADYANSVVTLQPAEFRGTGTSLRVQGSVPLAGTAAPNLTAQGQMDVSLLRIVAPDMQSSGIVSLDVHATGSAQSPQVQGQVKLQQIALATPDAPVGVEKLNGTLDIANDRVQISSLTGEVGGGEVSLGGSITYRPNVQFNVALQSKSVRLRYPEGLRTLLDTNLALSGNTESSTLTGRVLIDSLGFTPDFDLARFSDQFGGSAAPSQPGFADTVKLAVALQSKENLSATSSQVSIEGNVNLQVIGTAANPVIIGRTDLSSGELFYRSVRYELQRGIISFNNPTETQPVLDVSVNTTIEQYNLTLTLRGPFEKLTTAYVSDPPLATADIINLIARGKTTEEANAASQSTDSMIASQAASQLSGGIQKLAGISSLQIDPLIGGNNQNPSARVAIQQRVTKNLLFSFSTDVSQPGSEMVEGDYQITKRWSASVARDQLGGVSVDGKFHTRF